MRNFLLVGLTGPTGAGKSTISQMLQEKGCFILDGDVMAKKALEKGSTCLTQLVITFGEEILQENQEVNRKALAEKAFATPENTEKLNNITHPWICLDTMRKIDRLRKQEDFPIIVLDAAAILESKMDILCDYVVSVLADKNLREKRIQERDNLTAEQAKARMHAQKNNEFYLSGSDFVIYSDKGTEAVKQQTEALFEKLLKKKGGGCN